MFVRVNQRVHFYVNRNFVVFQLSRYVFNFAAISARSSIARKLDVDGAHYFAFRGVDERFADRFYLIAFVQKQFSVQAIQFPNGVGHFLPVFNLFKIFLSFFKFFFRTIHSYVHQDGAHHSHGVILFYYFFQYFADFFSSLSRFDAVVAVAVVAMSFNDEQLALISTVGLSFIMRQSPSRLFSFSVSAMFSSEEL